MRALVVYESQLGTTRGIAHAIADGLREGLEVVVRRAGEVGADDLSALALVAAGCSSHVRLPSSAGSRERPGGEPWSEGAPDRSAWPAGASPGGAGNALAAEPRTRLAPCLRAWLAHVRLPSVPAAAFATSLVVPPPVAGGAAPRVARALVRAGATLVARPESFLVAREGALEHGELDRAWTWGRALAAAAPEPAGLEPATPEPATPGRA